MRLERFPILQRFSRLAWLNRVRLSTIVFVIGVPLALFSWSLIPLTWLPVVVAAAGVTFSKLTSRLTKATCYTCGTDLTGQAHFEHGIICPECGALNQHMPTSLAHRDSFDDDESDQA